MSHLSFNGRLIAVGVYDSNTPHSVAHKPCLDRARAEAVSCRTSAVEARVHFQVKSRGICGGRCSSEAPFLRVLQFPLTVLFPPPVQHSLPSRADTISQIVIYLPSGLSPTPPEPSGGGDEQKFSARNRTPVIQARSQSLY
jgi:hypothetical protein